jgi:hypothetical protein
MGTEEPPYREPLWLEGLNELGEVLEGISIALDRPERFSTPALSALAKELEEVAGGMGSMSRWTDGFCAKPSY